MANFGGHLGFCFHLVPSNDERLYTAGQSWMPLELARFLRHIQTKDEQANH